MSEIFTQIEPWHWMSLGFVLLILEMFAPSTLFLWMGISAIVVSILQWFIPEFSWQAQFVLFGIFSLGSYLGWRYIAKKRGYDKEDAEYSTLNQRSASLVGRRAVLNEPIENGIGRIQLDDTYWRIEGNDLPQGSRVVVTGVDGATLRVEAVEP